MKRILITGGSGFIGTNLVQSLIEDGVSVLSLDKKSPQRHDHLPYWKAIDILNYEKLENEIKKFDPEVILHLAAVTDLDGSTLSYYDANIRGTQNIIDIAQQLPSLRKVIYTSSMYVCKPGYIPKDFDDYKPHTTYGESKVQGELLVKKLTDTKYHWTIIRPTSIWGPWFGIPYIDFFNVVYQGKYFDFGNTCSKSYGYIDNSVYQIKKLIDADTHRETFYIGDNPPIQISEWANEISIEMGKGPIKKIPYFIIRLAAWGGDVLGLMRIKFPMTSFRLSNMTTNNILPLDNLYAVTGPSPVTRLEAVRRTLKWLREYKAYQITSNQ